MRAINNLLAAEKLAPLFVRMARVPYFFLKLLPVQDKVVMISRNNFKTCIPFQMLDEEIRQQHPKTKVVILNHKMRSRVSHVRDILIEMYHLATSQACIVDTYVIAVSILKHKPHLRIVQIWHALGAVKNFGYLTLDKPAGNTSEIARVMNMHGNYTYITCASKATAKIYMKTFHAERKQIKIIGSPRIDYLSDKEIAADNRKKIRERYPEINGKKVILYVPTFRKGGRIRPEKLIAEFNATDSADQFVMIIKQHRLDKTRLPHKKSTETTAPEKIIYVREEFGSLELLAIADFVITDYSAIVFEAAVLGKPLYFYDYDYAEYAKNCGFAMNYEREMPGMVSANAKKIMTAIKAGEVHPRKMQSFRKKWIETDDGQCTKKIVKLLKIGE